MLLLWGKLVGITAEKIKKFLAVVNINKKYKKLIKLNFSLAVFNNCL